MEQDKKKYCCKEKCFTKHYCEIDGLACDKCLSYSQCHCKCKSYMKNVFPVKEKYMKSINRF